MTDCQTCGRRPSERIKPTAGARVSGPENRMPGSCRDPIHDAADRYAAVGEEMEKAITSSILAMKHYEGIFRGMSPRAKGQIPMPHCITTAEAVLDKLPLRS